jgi:signal transduction histidine kinase
VEVQESERRYIARELHDEAGQALTSLKVGLSLLEREVEKSEALTAGIVELSEMIDGIQENLHRLAMNLRPASLDHLGLVAGLSQYIEAVSDQHGLMAEFEAVGVTGRFPVDIETAVYRIVQEAVTNVIRHAQATRLDVLLDQRNDRLVVLVEDNGIGFDPWEVSDKDHLGIIGMRERAEMLGGELQVECSPGTGTTIRVEVPHVFTNTDRG